MNFFWNQHRSNNVKVTNWPMIATQLTGKCFIFILFYFFKSINFFITSRCQVAPTLSCSFFLFFSFLFLYVYTYTWDDQKPSGWQWSDKKGRKELFFFFQLLRLLASRSHRLVSSFAFRDQLSTSGFCFSFFFNDHIVFFFLMIYIEHVSCWAAMNVDSYYFRLGNWWYGVKTKTKME